MQITAEAADKLKQGDSAAWSAFIRECDPVVRHVTAWARWRFAPHVQDDIVQQVLSELPHTLDTLVAADSPDQFIRRIGVRRCIDEVRRQVRQRQHFLDPPPSSDDNATPPSHTAAAGPAWDPVCRIIHSEQARILAEQVGKLGENCQTLIRQFYVDGLSYEALATRHSISVSTVGTRLFRCLASLRQRIEQNAEIREDLRPSVDSEGERRHPR